MKKKQTILHVLLAIMLLGLCSNAKGQGHTFDFKNMTLEEIFEELGKNPKHPPFHYLPNDLIGIPRVTIKIKGPNVYTLLDTLCKIAPISYKYANKLINIKRTSWGLVDVPRERNQPTYGGVVRDNQLRPIPDVYVIKRRDSQVVAITDIEGKWKVTSVVPIPSLLFSHVNYEDKSVSTGEGSMDIVLTQTALPEKPVQCGNLSHLRRTGTGSIVTLQGVNLGEVKPKSLGQTMVGRVPGLNVKPTSGAYGTIEKMKIRGNAWLGLVNGTSTITQNAPLIILDNTPLPSIILNQIGYGGVNPNAGGAEASGMSILRTINIDDIESVVVLKDGDATAIYGSRGANGVIIINTKRAKKNEPYVTCNINVGFAKSDLRLKMLSTEQYLVTRKEAFKNDGLAITEENAPDLVLYDQKKNVNYKDFFFGNKAETTRGNVSVSDATDNWGYGLGMGYYREGSILPGKLVGMDYYDKDWNLTGSMYQKSKDGKRFLSVNGTYFNGKTSSITPDIAQAIKLFPSAPQLQDSTGKLTWNKGFVNPLSYLLQSYNVNIDNASSNYNFSYVVDSSFVIRSNGGLNLLNINEEATLPIKAQDPLNSPRGEAEFASTFIKNEMFELFGVNRMKRSELSIENMAGFTIMRQKVVRDKITAFGIPSDVLLLNQQAADSIESTNNTTKYGYIGGWANSKLIYKDRYLLNLTLRRDGSSRFGANRQFGTFGGIGAGWVFSKDSSLRLPQFITFGKLRATYGITGNDEIGDYAWDGSWARSNTQRPYAGLVTFSPTGHTNADFSWGICRKFDVSAEFTFKNLINVSATYYHNTYTNQLISESLPNYTGFGAIVKNSTARTVSNGFELYVQKRKDDNRPVNWECTVAATIPRTRLKYFPAFESSNYVNTLSIGSPVNTMRGFVFAGVNPSTGIYEFLDVNNDNLLNKSDYLDGGTLDPKFYGGVNNTFYYKSFILDFLWEFSIQKGINQLLDYSPMKFNNGYSNVPVQLLQHWQTKDDVKPYQVYTASTTSNASNRLGLLRSSNAQLASASYLRLKNISLSYACKPLSLKRKQPIQANTSFYIAAENLILLTGYKGSDPASQQAGGIPILKRFSIGAKMEIK